MPESVTAGVVVDSTTGSAAVLVFRYGTLTDPIIGTFTFGPNGKKVGISPVHCTGEFTNSLRPGDIAQADFYMSNRPGC